MRPSSIYAIFLRQIYLTKSNPARLTGIFVWVVLDIVQWGFITKYLGGFGGAAFTLASVILGAVILWEFFVRIQHGIMTAFLEDIWSRNFINFFASPLKIGEYISGLVLTSIVTGVAGFAAMFLLAGALFDYNILRLGVMILPFIFILFIFGTAMGTFVSALIFRLGPAAEWLGWPIPFALSVFAGVFYPLSVLPVGMQMISKLIPASYVFESMRAIINSGAFSGQMAINLFLGFALASIYLLLAYIFFVKIYRYNLRE
ncbi:MAG: ABC transporter permease, partial [Candidatus Portnoybacteria bacterium]|nr:ABC transporter permease [Candidatus Portnoybacteria bacterium]